MSDMIDREAAIDALKQQADKMSGWSERYAEQRKGVLTAVNIVEDLPSAQPEKHTEERAEMHACDCISRQAAIDIERNATVDTNPLHFEAHQKFMQFMDDAEISSFGRWQWSNGFNTALTAVGIDLKKLPSAAQPEIIRCKDCKHHDPEDRKCDCGHDILWQLPRQDDWYCADAERRTDMIHDMFRQNRRGRM